jgi:hypothetical protein
MFYEVLVGNIGKVWDSQSHDDTGDLEAATGIYRSYVMLSKDNYGRAAGEDVTLWGDAEIIEEHVGSITMALPE